MVCEASFQQSRSSMDVHRDSIPEGPDRKTSVCLRPPQSMTLPPFQACVVTPTVAAA